ncbi:haloacid dehalogenase [Brucella melitensis]|uniref:(S)-2-haloacid dehalogenase n=2 Tax=Brucella TaxID=234 RepID=Q8YFZ4_BRUME|nr:2-haloalkanoic acid dehalogenase i [Brucella melitensis bv. 1 str. 16M]AIJ86170.1 haloacid dehalogenase, type II [Brucella melitensis bv. 3 str. Ether]AOG49382.1 haloacid dehalogenase, type II [Brucella melitensis]ENQ69416.1 haloacid dehalogenase, type II [Brucella melitensis CNGB 1076]ENQ72505.1 haloacid dehalogenase, type II [Brucella melitensis CNGB 1120]ENQ75789.1 haloacid dehalogenase, type II [Brucella melitensis CNGB 290]ENQ79154.1 haloacid dehalogenase, type II [Brucella melitensis
MSYSSYAFDAYGTLFDVHSAVRRHADKAGPDGRALSELWRAKQLEYSWVLSLMGAYSDFWKLTEESLDYALAHYPSVDPALRNDLLDAYWKLDCYPEVPAALKALKDRGARLAILSNGSPAMLEAAVRSAALDVLLDDVISVDMVKKYKTSLAVYELIAVQWRSTLPPSRSSHQTAGMWRARCVLECAACGSTVPTSRMNTSSFPRPSFCQACIFWIESQKFEPDFYRDTPDIRQNRVAGATRAMEEPARLI